MLDFVAAATKYEVRGTKSSASGACKSFPLLEDGGHVHENEQEEVPRGGELELPAVDLELPREALAAACQVLSVFGLAKHDVRDVNWVEGFHIALDGHSQGHQQPAPPPLPPLAR